MPPLIFDSNDNNNNGTVGNGDDEYVVSGVGGVGGGGAGRGGGGGGGGGTGADSYISGVSNDSNESNLISASKRINFLARKKGRRKLTRTEKEDLRNLRNSHSPHLLMQSYHLPGYKYWEDLGQYLSNNHPIFGICCAHKLHPIGFKVRCLSLIGSLLFGLAVTNSIYLAFAFSSYDYSYSHWEANADFSTGADALDNNIAGIQITNGNIALWTLGSVVHALYDHVVWEFSSCSCCMEPGISLSKIKRYQQKGVYFVVLSVVLALAFAMITMVMREVVQNETNADGSTDSNVDLNNVTDSSSVFSALAGSDGQFEWDLSFFYSYLVEMALNYFFYYPLVGFILFTGILGCFGRIPVLGGRPYEMKVEQRENEEYLETMMMMPTVSSPTISITNANSAPSASATAGRNIMMNSSVNANTNANSAAAGSSVANRSNRSNYTGADGDVEMQAVVTSTSGHSDTQPTTTTDAPIRKNSFRRTASNRSGLGGSSHHSNGTGTGSTRRGLVRTMSTDSNFSGDGGGNNDGIGSVGGKSQRNIAVVSSTTALPYTKHAFGKSNSIRGGLGSSSHHSGNSGGSRPGLTRTLSNDGSFRVGAVDFANNDNDATSKTTSQTAGSTAGNSTVSNKSQRHLGGRPPIVGSGTTALPFTKRAFKPSTTSKAGLNATSDHKARPGLSRASSTYSSDGDTAGVPIEGSTRVISNHVPKVPSVSSKAPKPPAGPSLLSRLASSRRNVATKSDQSGVKGNSNQSSDGDAVVETNNNNKVGDDNPEESTTGVATQDTPTTTTTTTTSTTTAATTTRPKVDAPTPSMGVVAESDDDDDDDTSFAEEDDNDDDAIDKNNKNKTEEIDVTEMSSSHKRSLLMDVASTIDDMQKIALAKASSVSSKSSTGSSL